MQGLQIWDASGKLIFDSNRFTTTKYLGQTRITGSSGTYTDSKINGLPVWVMIIGKESASRIVPYFTSSGNTIVWETDGTAIRASQHAILDYNGDQAFTVDGWIDIIYGTI